MLERLAEALVVQGLQVIRFDFRYVRQRMRGGIWSTWPDDSLQWQTLEFRQQVLRYRRQERLEAERLPLILGGYSRGGLIATLVADLTSAAGSFALGFPFHSPGNTTEWRSAHLASAIKPVLLLNGDQDPYGYPDELVDVPLAESVELHWLPDRNHGMTYASAVDRNPIDSIQEMAGQIVAFGQRLIADA
jgi:predicted alpha/beta-hydrolase family hydrolase